MHDLPLSSRHDSSEASGTQILDAEVRILPPVFMIIPRLIAREESRIDGRCLRHGTAYSALAPS